ncbi:unnamed protein product [Heligmosomoides polygyrus]|uniref:TMV resistance protein N-like n=1 Tax=Heligmosomoides polygyrus TaxID=6339 RepID=A0A3P8BZN9_HELPZ|nr:unnamed protein product [Heligmosomoides polygyrus]
MKTQRAILGLGQDMVVMLYRENRQPATSKDTIGADVIYQIRDEGDGGNDVTSPQVIDLSPISTYLPEENIERPALRSFLHSSQAMGSLEKLISSQIDSPDMKERITPLK